MRVSSQSILDFKNSTNGAIARAIKPLDKPGKKLDRNKLLGAQRVANPVGEYKERCKKEIHVAAPYLDNKKFFRKGILDMYKAFLELAEKTQGISHLCLPIFFLQTRPSEKSKEYIATIACEAICSYFTTSDNKKSSIEEVLLCSEDSGSNEAIERSLSAALKNSLKKGARPAVDTVGAHDIELVRTMYGSDQDPVVNFFQKTFLEDSAPISKNLGRSELFDKLLLHAHPVSLNRGDGRTTWQIAEIPVSLQAPLNELEEIGKPSEIERNGLVRLGVELQVQSPESTQQDLHQDQPDEGKNFWTCIIPVTAHPSTEYLTDDGKTYTQAKPEGENPVKITWHDGAHEHRGPANNSEFDRKLIAVVYAKPGFNDINFEI